jgi:hypothetical protein
MRNIKALIESVNSTEEIVSELSMSESTSTIWKHMGDNSRFSGNVEAEIEREFKNELKKKYGSTDFADVLDVVGEDKYDNVIKKYVGKLSKKAKDTLVKQIKESSLLESKIKKADIIHIIEIHRRGRVRETTGTIKELLDYFSYTLLKGKSWEHEKGNSKINKNPKTGEQLVKNINNSERNAAANGNPSTYYEYGGEQDSQLDK